MIPSLTQGWCEIGAALGLSAVSHRQTGLRAVGTQSEPLIVDAQSMDTLLSQADAVAANAFLSGGIEPAASRAQYLAAITAAVSIRSSANADTIGASTDARRSDAIR